MGVWIPARRINRWCTAGLVVFCLFVIAIAGLPHASAQRSRANSRQIDPVREGDAVEVKSGFKWYPGTVISYANGSASIEYEFAGSSTTRDFRLDDVRFPNGEGHWTIWKDASGKFKVEARYIARDETSVMIRKADGSELTIPIDKLSLDLRQRVRQTPITGEENKIDGANPVRVGDEIQVQYFSSWYDGVVKRVLPGQVEVDYQYRDRTESKTFDLKDIRFPNGEGRWREWTDASGQFKIVARYISRTQTHVTIRKEDGNDLEIPIDRLSSKLRRLLAETPVTGEETLVDGVNPIRVGDHVEIKSTWSWIPGVIKETRAGGAVVEYEYHSSTTKKEFKLADIRFPNGEGHWRKWQDDSGSFELIARYISRNETHATLVKEDGNQVKVPIERLSTKLRRILEQTLAISRRPEKIEFGLSPKTTSFLSTAPSFAQLSLSGLTVDNANPHGEGGFGFQMTHGDTISACIPVGGVDPWIAIGTYATSRFNGPRLTRMYWTKPTRGKVVPGPNFQPDERIIDYSATQGRLITLQVTEGTWEQPKMFCTYRVAAGEAFATPEAAWDVAEKKRSYGRGSDYMARLVGENQLLLADGNAVSLYDFQSNRITYTLTGLASNSFTLHPSKHYFAVTSSAGVTSLHDTLSGRQVATAPAGVTNAGVGYSKDGTQLVLVGSKSVNVYDLQQNSPARTLLSRNLSASGKSQISLVSDDWIWADSYIFSTEKQMVVWSYSGSGVSIAKSQMLGDSMLVAATSGSYRAPKTALVGIAKVPHEEAINVSNGVDADEMIMLKPGAGIKVEAPGDPRIRAGILRVIQANGWREDPSSDVVFHGTAKPGEQKTMKYQKSSRFGMPFGRVRDDAITITASPWEQRAWITFRGQTAWSSGSGGLPYSMYLREGETVQGEVNKSTQPNYSLFERLSTPAEMLYPQYRYGLGKTAITISGFKDQVNTIDPEEKDDANQPPPGVRPGFPNGIPPRGRF